MLNKTFSDRSLKPSVTNTRKLEILQWVQGNLAARVRHPPHSSGPR